MKNTSRILALLLALLTVLTAVAMTGCQTTSNDKTSEETKEDRTEEPNKDSNSTFDTNFAYSAGLDWINALDFGFKNDGKTPNDKVFAEYAKYNSSKPLYFPSGVYCFAETLNFPDCIYVEMDPEAELKCIAEEPLEFFITLRGQYQDQKGAWCAYEDYAMGYLNGKGGTINCNNRAKCAIGSFQGMGVSYRDFKIYDVLEKGIQTLISKTVDGCASYEGIRIYNHKALPGTIGVYDNGYDNSFEGVSVINFETAYYTNGGEFKSCSAWNLDMSVIETSTFAVIYGTQSKWADPSADTYRYGFRITPWASTAINNMRWVTNKAFYTDELQAQYPRTMFVADEPENAQIRLDGLQFNAEQYLDFSNEPLPGATFYNVRLASGGKPANYKNYRDDLAGLFANADEIVALVPEIKSGNFTAASDFNEIKEAGIYKCELRVGKNGVGVPTVKDAGILRVEVIEHMVIQTFLSTKGSCQRLFDGTKWGEWLS